MPWIKFFLTEKEKRHADELRDALRMEHADHYFTLLMLQTAVLHQAFGGGVIPKDHELVGVYGKDAQLIHVVGFYRAAINHRGAQNVFLHRGEDGSYEIYAKRKPRNA